MRTENTLKEMTINILLYVKSLTDHLQVYANWKHYKAYDN